MYAFIYLFLFRVISGIQNGLGYAVRRREGRAVLRVLRFTLMLLLIGMAILPPIQQIGRQSTDIIVFAFIGSWISIAGAFGVEDSFNLSFDWLPTDVHLWEMLCTTGIALSLLVLGYDVVMILTSVYPALLLHKGAVNLGSGQRFWYHGTDDATGRYFTIPLLGWRIPRASLRTRQIIAGASLLVAVAYWWTGRHLDLYDLLNLI